MNHKLIHLLCDLRLEVMTSRTMEVQPISMSVSGISMDQHEPIKATIRVNFAPLYIQVGGDAK